ncbi:MAG: hypothetical protein QM817_04490 [Archangium sp.]
MRTLSAAALFFVVALVANPARAQMAISGTATVAFEGFNMYGVPQTRLTLNLSCSLSCPPSRPELHFSSIVDAWFDGAPTERTGYVSAFFGSDASGANSYVNDGFSAGSAFFIIGKSSSCWCGNANGEGGYIDIKSNTAAIPPWVGSTTGRAGSQVSTVVNANPRGAETVEVKLLGAGLDETRTLTPADFGTQKAAFVRFTPTAPGTLVLTATLKPFGAGRSTDIVISADTSSSGGGGGGDATGGGSGGGGGGADESNGCSTSPVIASMLMLGAWLRRRQ